MTLCIVCVWLSSLIRGEGRREGERLLEALVTIHCLTSCLPPLLPLCLYDTNENKL